MRRILAVLVGLWSLDVSALKVVPFVHSFNPEDRNESSFQYYIENSTDDYMAFEISIFKRRLDRNGQDILEKDDESFTIYPRQIIIPPHSHRSVKVQWKGNKEFTANPNLEQAFRVRMEQFPINKDQKKAPRKTANIQVTYEIKASLYATPKDAKEHLTIVKSDSKTIVIRNSGTKRGEPITSNLNVNGTKIVDLISQDESHSVVMPHSERVYHRRKNNLQSTQKRSVLDSKR